VYNDKKQVKENSEPWHNCTTSGKRSKVTVSKQTDKQPKRAASRIKLNHTTAQTHEGEQMKQSDVAMLHEHGRGAAVDYTKAECRQQMYNS